MEIPLALLASSSTDHRVYAYVAFLALIGFFLALDLGVFHREVKEITFKESIFWSIVWFVVALAFMPVIVWAYDHHFLGLGLEVPKLGSPGVYETVSGTEAAKLYFTGYIMERALAMDNTFVIALVFGYLAIPGRYQHRVLFWGILGALIMRGIMIFVGAALIERFHWVTYVFAAILIITAFKMAGGGEENAADPSKNAVVRLLKRCMPVTDRIDGPNFFVRLGGVLHATPLFVALIIVEITDLVFAVDSIPAIFAISADPFILFTSNIFAILGLRALYFCIAALLERFRFLKPALIVVLFFVGVKMLLVHTTYKVDTTASLLVIVGILTTGAVASAVFPDRRRNKHANGSE